MIFKNLSFNRRLSIYLFLIFMIFSFVLVALQYHREKQFRVRQLNNTLDNITEMTHNLILENGLIENRNFSIIDSFKQIIPQDYIRITIIDERGVVFYDSEVTDETGMENHLQRPEVQLSVWNKFGSNVRKSATTGNKYYYFAKYYNDYFIRTAALYNVDVRNFLKAERIFILFLVSICVITGLILLMITQRLSQTINRLKEFALAISRGEKVQDVKFPEGELGVVSSEIVRIYKKLNDTRDTVNVEQNKLFNHLQALNEGVAFFSEKKERLFTNNLFIHFLNHISERSTLYPEEIFKLKELKPLNDFISKILSEQGEIHTNLLPQYETEIFRNNKYFLISCIFFEDRNFEILIRDISKMEKRKLLKQQMTSNMAHELRTPVATILAYMETLKSNKIDNKKRQYFIDKAYSQAVRLSELLEDLFTLNRIEETQNQYVFEKVCINDIISEVEENLQLKMQEKQIRSKLDIPDKLMIEGNRSLLFSIFYNLYENAIKYGGKNCDIILSNYLTDQGMHHFSFANTGNEIEDKHLSRIFERFYRVDSGRSRKSGGTGLGLAIVKNAIQLHNGNISARRYKDGGLEFLFTLAIEK